MIKSLLVIFLLSGCATVTDKEIQDFRDKKDDIGVFIPEKIISEST